MLHLIANPYIQIAISIFSTVATLYVSLLLMKHAYMQTKKLLHKVGVYGWVASAIAVYCMATGNYTVLVFILALGVLHKQVK